MDLGGVRWKMARKNCERKNGKRLRFFKRWMERRRTTFFFQRYGNFILTPTVHEFKNNKYMNLKIIYMNSKIINT